MFKENDLPVYCGADYLGVLNNTNICLCSSAILHSVDWQLVNDVLGEHISPIFRGQGVQEDAWPLKMGLTG